MRYTRAIEALKQEERITDHNRRLILRFVGDLQAEGISELRTSKYLHLLRQLTIRFSKNLDKVTPADTRRIVAEINRSDYADWSKNDYKITLKRFYKWLRKLPDQREPPETSWIRTGHPKNGMLPEELLTEDDVTKLAKNSENSRDHAFVLCVYETGGRIGELLNLRRKHVQFDNIGAALIFSGKTGDRRVRVITAAPALSHWLNDHPSDDSEAPLWTIVGDKHHGEPLLYDSARALLQRLARKAGVKKKVNPQTFRHSRASYLANHFTEQQLEQYLGWTQGSRMPGTYVHLSGRDTDSAILKMHGLNKEEEKQKTKLTIRTCPRCQQLNDPTVRFCAKCGLPLEIEDVLEIENQRRHADTIMSMLLEDPEVKALLLTKLRKLVPSQSSEDQETKPKPELPR
jgi:integrase/recombinase XerD